eukprot:gnl/MRDRNA2_/MRDRNA2_96624_c0_seq1.p1 gnl/MRDRNA2_/MRDRNA2_96624_c0~~gnl/MRDRNA2_/MRDRNA2_96624_c0_seq1.p1  ORF type:complete len:149 (+),score=24.20 gnl/MRDRNA2_/MRDRNA2_96624_c0_seq1:66-449(+)
MARVPSSRWLNAIIFQILVLVKASAHVDASVDGIICENRGNKTLTRSQCYDQDGNICTASVSFDPGNGTNCKSIGYPCVCCGNTQGHACTGAGGGGGCICNTIELPVFHYWARCYGCDQKLQSAVLV